MPRTAAHLEKALRQELVRTEDLLRQFESAKARQRSKTVDRITSSSIDLVYELAYLNIFKKWEETIEESFLRFMCGYENSAGPPTFVPGIARQLTLAAATKSLFAGRDYLLWHSSQAIVSRSKKHFVGHAMELVINSKSSDLDHYANVRHRIAHGQEDSRKKFDASTMALAASRYDASSAGRFLRDWVPSSTPPKRWLHEIGWTLHSLAVQIVA